MTIKNYNETAFQKSLIDLSPDVFDVKIRERFSEFFSHLPSFEIGRGWRPLLWELCQSLDAICAANYIKLEFERISTHLGAARFRVNYSIPDGAPDILGELIDSVVGHYERISNNICSDTGLTYDEKVYVGGRVFDVCLESFEKIYAGIEDIDLARNHVEKQSKISRARHLMSYLTDEDLNKVLGIVENAAK